MAFYQERRKKFEKVIEMKNNLEKYNLEATDIKYQKTKDMALFNYNI